jgi:hypothetical protein
VGVRKPRRSGEQLGHGMYPHFDVSYADATVEKARQTGYRIIQEPKKYDLAPKHSLLILMVTFGRLYLRRRSLLTTKTARA